MAIIDSVSATPAPLNPLLPLPSHTLPFLLAHQNIFKVLYPYTGLLEEPSLKSLRASSLVPHSESLQMLPLRPIPSPQTIPPTRTRASPG